MQFVFESKSSELIRLHNYTGRNKNYGSQLNIFYIKDVLFHRHDRTGNQKVATEADLTFIFILECVKICKDCVQK